MSEVMFEAKNFQSRDQPMPSVPDILGGLKNKNAEAEAEDFTAKLQAAFESTFASSRSGPGSSKPDCGNKNCDLLWQQEIMQDAELCTADDNNPSVHPVIQSAPGPFRSVLGDDGSGLHLPVYQLPSTFNRLTESVPDHTNSGLHPPVANLPTIGMPMREKRNFDGMVLESAFSIVSKMPKIRNLGGKKSKNLRN